jgi:hypothetical protein
MPYPMNTLGEPCADTDPHDTLSPILPAALPFMNTDDEPPTNTPLCVVSHVCGAQRSPLRWIRNPFANVSGLASTANLGG